MYFKTSVANVEMPLNIAGWSILPDSSPCSVSLLSISILYDRKQSFLKVLALSVASMIATEGRKSF